MALYKINVLRLTGWLINKQIRQRDCGQRVTSLWLLWPSTSSRTPVERPASRSQIVVVTAAFKHDCWIGRHMWQTAAKRWKGESVAVRYLSRGTQTLPPPASGWAALFKLPGEVMGGAPTTWRFSSVISYSSRPSTSHQTEHNLSQPFWTLREHGTNFGRWVTDTYWPVTYDTRHTTH